MERLNKIFVANSKLHAAELNELVDKINELVEQKQIKLKPGKNVILDPEGNISVDSINELLVAVDWNEIDNPAAVLGSSLGRLIKQELTNLNGRLTQLQTTVETMETDKHRVINMDVASTVWEVEHDMNKVPSVTVIDSVGREIVGDIQYVDMNHLIITFESSFSGKVILN